MTPCCLFTDDATIESDLEQFDCETCGLRAQLVALDEENQEAWQMYRRLARRILGDLDARAVALDRLTRGWPAARFEAMVDRLNVIHDVLQPPKPQET